MADPSTRRTLSRTTHLLGWAMISVTVLLAGSAAAGQHPGSHPSALTTLPGATFVAAPPTGAKGLDDITQLAVPGLDHHRAIIWVAYQNGINPNGTPGSPGGPTQSRVVGYDPLTAAIVRSINVTGKIDGLTADLRTGTLLATVNEDDNSALNVIYPRLGAVATYAYSPNPAVSGNGGTDSLAIVNGMIFVAHSNPNDTLQAAEYRVTLHTGTLTAQLNPVFYDDSVATVVGTHHAIPLALTDPDTNYAMPSVSPAFAGELATVSQADGKLIFAKAGHANLHLQVLNLSDNVSGNVPPIDGFSVSTCATGTLYVVDSGAGNIQMFNTSGYGIGTVFVGEPSDNHNPLLGTLDLSTGVITPFGNHFVSPKGLLFVPGAGC